MTHRHQLTCSQFVDLADAFALNALDELEEHACARHILRSVHHAGCREALAAVLPGSRPPVGLWQAIEARLGIGTGSSNAEWL